MGVCIDRGRRVRRHGLLCPHSAFMFAIAHAVPTNFCSSRCALVRDHRQLHQHHRPGRPVQQAEHGDQGAADDGPAGARWGRREWMGSQQSRYYGSWDGTTRPEAVLARAGVSALLHPLYGTHLYLPSAVHLSQPSDDVVPFFTPRARRPLPTPLVPCRCRWTPPTSFRS